MTYQQTQMTFLKVNGLVLHYQHIRTRSNSQRGNRTFLFINSLGTDFRIWTDVVDILTEFGDIVLFDKRGHGLSSTAPSQSTLDDFADDAEALLNHLSISKCIAIGLSVGGMIAQILACRRPSKFEKLILCDTCHKIGNVQIWNDRIKAVKGHGFSSISGSVMQRWFSESFHKTNPETVAGYRNMLERTSKSGYIQTCEAIRDANLAEVARQIKVATLCVVGSEDKSTTPDDVKSLVELIRGAKFQVIEGSAHIPCVDNPYKLSRAIIDFINDKL
ncbi:3-oxoadipate enol-lactonase [Chryseolinea serpens]|uniref:3-oxoadipate enol-lactonase n=2 Tax=Chryseolinea serpens TaxID=947013 RepID=A0A1M5TD51_9BACT|nr:3-oxoadipate enol-lactonase [Chryseolinea serpens]